MSSIPDLQQLSPLFASFFDQHVKKPSTIHYRPNKDAKINLPFVLERPSGLTSQYADISDAYNSVLRGGVIFDRSLKALAKEDSRYDMHPYGKDFEGFLDDDRPICDIFFDSDDSHAPMGIWYAWNAQESLDRIVALLTAAKERYEYAKKHGFTSDEQVIEFLEKHPLLFSPENTQFAVTTTLLEVAISVEKSSGFSKQRGRWEPPLIQIQQDRSPFFAICEEGSNIEEIFYNIAKTALDRYNFDGSL